MTDSDPSPFSITVFARWSDMDFNAHMRNTAFLEVAEDCRMAYFAQHGFPMTEFGRLQLGPVITEDHLRYRRELRLLEEATVTQQLGGLSVDGGRFRLRNDVIRQADGELAAVVTSTIVWFDLAARRPTTPPDDLAALVAALPRTDDFQEL